MAELQTQRFVYYVWSAVDVTLPLFRFLYLIRRSFISFFLASTEGSFMGASDSSL